MPVVIDHEKLVGFEHSLPELQLDSVITDSNLIQAGKFRSIWIVGYESCGMNQIFAVTTSPQNCLLEQKLMFILIIFFDNFFKYDLM